MRTAALALLLAAAPLAAAPASALAAPRIAVSGAWSRPAAAGGSAVGFMTLTNHGRPDALVGADSPAARRVEVHVSSMAGGVMRMTPAPVTPLPAQGRVSFAPGGRHLMFVGLKHALKPGDRLPATLRFRSGARVPVEFRVAAGPPGGAMAGMPGMH
jgi:copper(I)-binding protein